MLVEGATADYEVELVYSHGEGEFFITLYYKHILDQESESCNFCFMPHVKIYLTSLTYSVKYCMFCITYFLTILFNNVLISILWRLHGTEILKAFAFLHFQHATSQTLQCAYKILGIKTCCILQWHS
jgi:hypothetical protein